MRADVGRHRSVHHEVGEALEPAAGGQPRLQLMTSNASSDQFVSHGLAPHLVIAGEPAVFTYDVIYKAPHPPHPPFSPDIPLRSSFAQSS